MNRRESSGAEAAAKYMVDVKEFKFLTNLIEYLNTDLNKLPAWEKVSLIFSSFFLSFFLSFFPFFCMIKEKKCLKKRTHFIQSNGFIIIFLLFFKFDPHWTTAEFYRDSQGGAAAGTEGALWGHRRDAPEVRQHASGALVGSSRIDVSLFLNISKIYNLRGWEEILTAVVNAGKTMLDCSDCTNDLVQWLGICQERWRSILSAQVDQ